jgi:hypothetical protein
MSTLNDGMSAGQRAAESVDSQPRDLSATIRREATGPIGYDARGNAIWLWLDDASSTSGGILQQFDAGDLKLEDHCGKDRRAKHGGGYDPYNSG